MLRELGKADWQSILNLPDERIPKALLLRGTRNLRQQYDAHRAHFDDVIPVGLPNGIVEDVFVGRLYGQPVGYASVYGAPMTSEIVHLFGVLGTRLVVLTGCCAALADEIEPGDLVVTSEAFCGEGAAAYYRQNATVVRPTIESTAIRSQAASKGFRGHVARMYTTAALFAEGRQEIDQWWSLGFGAVDMETATTLAVAEHFGMESLAIHFAFDNPRRGEHILLAEPDKQERRRCGNESMTEIALSVIRDYLATPG
jgi:uridine phosphorylase